ncbi:MAG TPA: sugar phosphate isomerase/epimerase family protein [Vicinamibacterales bacterium]|nr:sugar phosphate isomerase/epimerase family protein [Vicinamibacterales bacterium]
MQFGISTHLYHDQRLSREHLAQIAAYGFEAVELFATRSHFDYRDPAAIAQLGRWLKDSGLVLHSIHAPIHETFGAGKGGATFSTAASDGAKRQAAVREAEAAIAILKQIPAKFVVVHLGTPAAKAGAGDNSRAAASRSVEEVCKAAEPLGARVALEVIPNDLSSAATLVTMLERDFDGSSVGLCMDFGHAHLMGDVADAIELAAEHLITTHVHDNRRREDDHLVPYQGTIDWAAALVTMQKIGYDGTYLMELANTGSPAAVLEEARRARQRIERALAD